MLGKLFKHEWKTTSKMGLLMLGAIAIVTILGVIGFVLPFSNFIIQENSRYTDEESVGMIISMLISMATMMVYIFTLMGVVYGMLIYMGVHFYKTMYSDEGYLTHTLPVTPRQLIISKVLNSSIWYGFITFAMIISMVILFGAMMVSMSNTMELPSEMGEVWNELFEVMWTEAGMQVVHMIVALILVFVVTPFATMMSLFGSITIGQLASKYRALMGILAYFGVCTLNGVISYVISFLFTIGTMVVSEMTGVMPNPAASYDATIITSLIMLVAFYFISHGILTKKLNME